MTFGQFVPAPEGGLLPIEAGRDDHLAGVPLTRDVSVSLEMTKSH